MHTRSGWRQLSALVIIGLAAAAASPTGQAQEPYAREAYGNGVHAFYAGELHEAERFFNQAVQAGSRDPRCYYFRGLTLMKLGRSLDAENDFRVAATLEVQGGGAFDVGRALMRVQGPDRLQLEEVRRTAKLVAAQTVAPPSPPPPPPGQPTAPVPAEGATTAPPTSAPPAAVPGRVQAPIDPSQLPDDPTDPFGTPAAEPPATPATPAEADPFGTPAAETPATAPATPADADPFDVGEDLFGEPANGGNANPPAGGATDDRAVDPFTTDDPFSTGAPAAGENPASASASPVVGAASSAARSLFRVFTGALPDVELPAGMPVPGGGMPPGAAPANWEGGPPPGFNAGDGEGEFFVIPSSDNAGATPDGFAPAEAQPAGNEAAPENTDPAAAEDSFDPFSSTE